MKTTAIAIIACLTALQIHAAEFRVWEDTKNNSLEAAFVKLAPGNVYLKTREGKTLKIKLSNLSEADQNHLAATVPPNLSLNLKTDKSKDSTRFHETYWVTGSADITKSGTSLYTQPLFVDLILIAKDEVNDDYIIVGHTEHAVEFAKGSATEQQTVTGKRIELFSGKGSVEHGAEYDGILAVISDEQGNILAVEANRDFYSQNAEELLALPTRTAFDKNLNITSKDWNRDNPEVAARRRRFR